MVCSALLVSVLVVGATGAPASSLRGSGRAALGKCCFNGCDDENSCVTGYCALQELCLKPQPDGGCDSSTPYGDGAKPSWCPAAAPNQLYSASTGDNVTANAVANALQMQDVPSRQEGDCCRNGEICSVYCRNGCMGDSCCCSGKCSRDGTCMGFLE
jgi:hypothetical protein